jgi:hypothetical protein
MPQIPEVLNDLWIQTTKASTNAVENFFCRSFIFFRDLAAVNNYIHNVDISFGGKQIISENAFVVKYLIWILSFPIKASYVFLLFRLSKISDYAKQYVNRYRIYVIKRQLLVDFYLSALWSFFWLVFRSQRYWQYIWCCCRKPEC